MRRPAPDTRKAIDAFISKKAEIDAMLARIAKLSEDHFGADPDKVNWGDVGTLEDYARHLRHITEAALRKASTPSSSSSPQLLSPASCAGPGLVGAGDHSGPGTHGADP